MPKSLIDKAKATSLTVVRSARTLSGVMKVQSNHILLGVSSLIVIIAACIIVPVVKVTVFDGYFDLSINVEPQEMLDQSSLLFATCWTEEEAEYALNTGTKGETRFDPGTAGSSYSRVISVPFSGRSDAFGNVTSYHEPKYLIVQYDFLDHSDTKRMRISIPTGPGDREMHVEVP